MIQFSFLPEWRIHSDRGLPRLPFSGPARILALVAILFACNARAQDNPAFRFDILRSADSVVVWLDLSPILTAVNVDRMKDGRDLAVECNLRLLRPRRLFGAVQMASVDQTFELSFQILTEQYFLNSSDSTAGKKVFPSQSGLFDHLADSIFIPVAALDSLTRGDRYELDASIATISLGHNSLESSGEPDGGSDSPLRWLYIQLLKVTGYGRTEYSFRSRPFGIAELYPLR
jgi:hypothetical protein